MSRKYHQRVGGESARQRYAKHQPGDCRIVRYVNGQPQDEYFIPAANLRRAKYLELDIKVRPTIDMGPRYARWSGK